MECTLYKKQTYGANCYAYAYLTLDSANIQYREQVMINNTSYFSTSYGYSIYSFPSLNKVARYMAHAGIVVNNSYMYFVHGAPYTEPLIRSVWTAIHCIINHPQSQGGFPGGVDYVY